MALNWEFIENVATKELSEEQDDAQVERLFDQLIQYKLTGTESSQQLGKLFECSKLVMRFKANQVDVAIEEIDELENIISRENANQKNFKSTLDRNVEKQTEQQLLELERANELLRTQLNEKDVELNRLEQTKSGLEQTLKLNERQLANYNQEIEQLRDELQIEKDQINEQLSNNNLPYEQLRDMNKKFYMLLDEMKDMETMNAQLGEKVVKLNEELDLATQQMQTATLEMQYMRNSLNNLQEMNDILINEKEDHLNEIRRLKSLTDNYELESDEHVESNSKKIQDLSEKLRSKEDELNELKAQFDSLDRKQIEDEKNYFVKEISKRDNHIKLLRNQLSQAIDDIEAQTRVIENLIEKNIENIHKTDNLDSKSGDKNGRVLNSNQLINKLEEELRSKDKEMTILHQRNTRYEKGIYGLSEAVEEMNKLSKLIKSKDDEIDRLIKELNAINLRLSNTQDELDYLKEIMNADEDLKQKLNEDTDVKNDKLKILKLQKEVIRLDGEKLKLYEQVLSNKMNANIGVKAFESNSIDESNVTIVSNRNQADIVELQKLNLIQQLENENRELQLAMKEILIGLKESDSKSDVIIDCPSLERLCQFFESRSINSNLANVIALKAELDILRGHNEELRMSNKRLRNDIFKIFENYSKHLLTDFVSAHPLEHNLKDELKDELKNESKSSDLNKQIDFVNQTMTEDELYDSDLSEGEIVLNSRNVVSYKKRDQETQTELDDQQMNELVSNQRESENLTNEDRSTDDLVDVRPEDVPTIDLHHQLKNDLNKQNTDLKERNDEMIHQNDQNDDFIEKKGKLNESNEQTDQLFEQKTDDKHSVDQMIQTDLCLNDLKNVHYLSQIDQIEQLLKEHSIEELKNLLIRDDLVKSSRSIDEVSKKDIAIQTSIDPIDLESNQSRCSQCSQVQDLLIEFQSKIDRIDSGIVQREDLYTERINVLQDENNRLQTEMQRMMQIKDDLLNQKEKQLIELNDKIVNQKEKIISLEVLNSELKNVRTEVNDQEIDVDKSTTGTIKLDKQSIDSQLAIINKSSLDSSNQRGMINVLETIIQCLQARIEHKDEAIAHYQQLLTRTQEEHQQEIQKLMKNYKKVTEHSIKAIQCTSSVNQEQLETTLVKYNDQLNDFKTYHQKVLAEQKKAFELQAGKMKRLKIENERLKSQTISSDEMNRLRTENEQLNKLIEKNVKFIEKLKNAIKEERAHKQETKCDVHEQEPGRMQLNKLKEETENLYKLLMSKDKQIKELQLSKWNLEKKISELIQSTKGELKAKTDELERMMSDQVKLRNLLEKIEKEKDILKRIRKNERKVINETNSIAKISKETQTDKVVNFLDSDNIHNYERKETRLEQFKRLSKEYNR